MELPRILDLGAAGPLWSNLSEHRGGALDLDASKVERIGGLCVQILLAAVRSWRSADKPVRIRDASDAFIACAHTLGAKELVELAEAG